MKFNVGDRVKLKDYNGHGDWESHRDQEAEIIRYTEGGADGKYPYRLRWKDDRESTAPESNMILVELATQEITEITRNEL